ncbi:MAG: hypothetical protein AAFR27_07220 [Pseudomonadota bacterium]
MRDMARGLAAGLWANLGGDQPHWFCRRSPIAKSNAITRRRLLRSVPSFAVPFTDGLSSNVKNAIARHLTADRTFSENCWRSDEIDPRFGSDTPENNKRIYWATLNAEVCALDELLSTLVLTRQDSTAKGKHLSACLRRDGLEARHFQPLLEAMIFE